MTARWVEAYPLDKISENTLIEWEFEGRAYIFVKKGKSLACFLDRCSHQDVKLSEFGEVRMDHIVCYAHGAEFACDSGKHLCMPATAGLTKFPVEIRKDRAWVNIAQGAVGS